jgi:hypothetical protein
MAKTTRKLPDKKASASDREQLKRIARKILNRLERSVDDTNDIDDAHDKLFGAKNSLVGALVTLTELVTNLGDVQQEKSSEENEIKMDESDVKLVKHYIARSKEREKAENAPILPSVMVAQNIDIKNKDDP